MDLMIKIGAVASFILPFFNIPLILRLIRRKSADDLSLIWVMGVWICIILMTPTALSSSDAVFRTFGATNLIFFSFVVFFTLKYRFFGQKKGRQVLVP